MFVNHIRFLVKDIQMTGINNFPSRMSNGEFHMVHIAWQREYQVKTNRNELIDIQISTQFHAGARIFTERKI